VIIARQDLSGTHFLGSTTMDLIQTFQHYLNLLNQSQGSNLAREDLANEAVERLKQIKFIETNLQEIDQIFGVSVIQTRINENGEEEYFNSMYERDEHLRFVMRLLTESFYYFAFRLRSLLRHTENKFIHLSQFESPGVRDVRNKLIEHPEKELQIFNQTWSWSKEIGMQLKSSRKEGDDKNFYDAGFKINFQEFIENLTAKLKNACDILQRELEIKRQPPH
jgi:hypothetical protein